MKLMDIAVVITNFHPNVFLFNHDDTFSKQRVSGLCLQNLFALASLLLPAH